MDNELRPFWNRIFSFNWKFGIFLILIVCIPRFMLVLNANASGNYSSIGLIMTISAIAPFLFLSKRTRLRTTLFRIAEGPRIKKRFKIKCKSPGHQRLGLLTIRCSATPGFRWVCSFYKEPMLHVESCFALLQVAK